jgi:hypothetical protein
MSDKVKVRRWRKLPSLRHRLAVLVAVLAVSVLLVSPAMSTPAEADTTTTGLISPWQLAYPDGNSACLDDWFDSTDAYNPVVAYPCDPYYQDPAQKWTLDTTNNTIQLANAGSHCLDVYAGGLANGARVDLYPCNNSGAQTWEFLSFPWIGPYVGEIYNPQSNKCLDIPNYANGLTYPGGSPINLDIWDCHGGTNQTWLFNPQ